MIRDTNGAVKLKTALNFVKYFIDCAEMRHWLIVPDRR